ncbi:serine hydrolase domain-containing protein [Marinospirillum sp.]|uniref:serine hydrolase domain-containing protein n=1 Tax=Marinospirillum sp. TaxID=2183934 RepID=UPI003A886C5D
MRYAGIKRGLLVGLSLGWALSVAAVPLSAEDSDPARWGWMQGSPPPPEKRISFADGSYFQFPQMRWSVAHFRQLMPTVQVARGTGPIQPLASHSCAALDALTFVPWGQSEPMTWAESMRANYTDGIAVLHRGQLIDERYFGALTAEGQHAAMSVTKSFMGLLGALLIEEGLLDAERQVVEYVPELGASAFGSATVAQLLDMTTGIRFSEDYADPNAEVWAHAAAGNPLPKPADYVGPRSYFEFLQTVQPEGEHGAAFHYRTANTDALGWVMTRATGQNVAQLLSERIWQPLGAEQDAYMTVDSWGTPFAGGGLNLSLRDLARFGELLRQNGRVGEQQVIPAAVIADLRAGGDQAQFAQAGYSQLEGWSYHQMWWITHNAHGALMARGVHGQALYIDPTAEMVIARFGSHPVAANAANDATSLPAYQALATFLLEGGCALPEG